MAIGLSSKRPMGIDHEGKYVADPIAALGIAKRRGSGQMRHVKIGTGIVFSWAAMELEQHGGLPSSAAVLQVCRVVCATQPTSCSVLCVIMKLLQSHMSADVG